MRASTLFTALAIAAMSLSPVRAAGPNPDAAAGSLNAPRQAMERPATGLDLVAVRRGQAAVPPTVPRDLPAKLASDAKAETRKALFLKAVLPAVLSANARIRGTRRFLDWAAWQRAVHGELTPRVQERLADLAERYGTEPDDLATLRRRVDTLPPALVLAQAAIESGWGGSRFAQQGNALFGQRSYHCDDCGMIPKGYDGDPGFRVESYRNVTSSVAAYLHNINTHSAYAELRSARRDARRQGKTLDADRLARHLIRYSERGEAYVRDIRRTIASNDLTEFDDARLTRRPQVARLPR